MSKTEKLTRLVLLRHGKSVWNKDRHFTGWSDIALSLQGEEEARRAGQRLKQAGFSFDICFCSELKRARDTLAFVQSEMSLSHLPVHRSWRLNERHYGALEGMRPWAAIRRFGIWPVLKSQLHFDAVPPLLMANDPRVPASQQRYAAVNHAQLPLAESMQQALVRVQPFWQQTILPEIRQGKRLLIVSHKGLLRTLVMQLEGLTGAQVMRLSITTGQPLCYELDSLLNPVNRYYLPG
ncbi:phosphoglycerate mutase [Nitrosomonas eutropha]|uniref:2,3-bisphosphoglycerate-dependent phosphoglycerate mutase n=1 Tax=Nitrosomonas TaxID=914 RepID=UPI00088BA4C7|nr:2,3-bisphosphoglycerate-dependent phosphoglycerate mutase [Nitrosomonas eutropha]MXS80959.1 2,3-bisphosphoglycerate-dependent phosphoglycerate mutase [Nitrosomonas sp. GH22]SCX13320.1 phosphoglycerate mutase [Nitrosomonas eutropha]SDW15040.1 phosphoglycerate mutase [Nitrosomonas eutropha]